MSKRPSGAWGVATTVSVVSTESALVQAARLINKRVRIAAEHAIDATVITLLLLACADPLPDSAPEPWLELGTGQLEYQPLEDGGTIELVYGPQGGWHVDVSARFGALELGQATLQYSASDATSGVALNLPYQAIVDSERVLPQADGWLRLGDRVVFDVPSDEDVLEREVLLQVQFTGDDELLLSDERAVTVVGPPGDEG